MPVSPVTSNRLPVAHEPLEACRLFGRDGGGVGEDGQQWVAVRFGTHPVGIVDEPDLRRHPDLGQRAVDPESRHHVGLLPAPREVVPLVVVLERHRVEAEQHHGAGGQRSCGREDLLVGSQGRRDGGGFPQPLAWPLLEIEHRPLGRFAGLRPGVQQPVDDPVGPGSRWRSTSIARCPRGPGSWAGWPSRCCCLPAARSPRTAWASRRRGRGRTRTRCPTRTALVSAARNASRDGWKHRANPGTAPTTGGRCSCR